MKSLKYPIYYYFILSAFVFVSVVFWFIVLSQGNISNHVSAQPVTQTRSIPHISLVEMPKSEQTLI